MNLRTFKYTVILFFSVFSGPVMAQNLRSAYFLDEFYYRYKQNPAFAPAHNFFSLPALGNVDITTQGNVGLSNFFFKYHALNGSSSLTTFLNASVDRDQFLKKLKRKNRIGANLSLNVFAFGFHGFGGFNTFDLGVDSRSDLNVPYALFDFMKTGQPNGRRTHYTLSDLQFSSLNYVDINFGHSRVINEKLRFGAAVKLLIGLGNFESRFDKMDIILDDRQWLIRAQGYMHASAKNLSFKTKDDREIESYSLNSLGIGGYGAGLDLGFSYQLLNNLILSASIIDLGFISWNHTQKGVTSSTPYSFTGFQEIGVSSSSSNPPLEEQLDGLKEDLKDWAKFYDAGVIRKYSMLSTTIQVGLKCELPSYQALSFGVLSTSYLNGAHSWTEGRVSTNISPLSWLDLSVSGAISNYGPSLGFVLNLHPYGFNLFLGTDMMILHVTPQFVPINSLNANFSMGINFPLGK